MSNKIKGFDGVRGLAVLTVVVTHLGIYDHLKQAGIITESMMPMLSGTTGVQAFFVLSGFLITMLLIKEYEKSGRVSLKNFYIRRSLRIIPLYMLVLILIGIIHGFGDKVTNWQALVFAFFYATNFIPNMWYSGLLGHTWSLAVEEHFYLIWPFIFSIFFIKKKHSLIFGLVTFIITSFILLNVLTSIDWMVAYFNIERWSFISGYNIALGCLSSVILFSLRTKVHWNTLLSNKLCLVIAVLLFVNSLYLPQDVYYIGSYLRGFGITIALIWLYLNQSSILIKILEFPPLRYIGVISYGIYMYQGFFLATGPIRQDGQTWPPDPLVGLILLLIVAPMSFHFFEKPFLKLKGKYSS